MQKPSGRKLSHQEASAKERAHYSVKPLQRRLEK